MAGLKSSQYTDQGATKFGDADYIGEILKTSESGNAQHHKQTVLNWNATQYKTNQTLSGSPAAWDTANRYFPFASLTVTASQNVNLSNVRDTASGTLLITKNTASDVVITFGGSGLTHSPASVRLVNSTINTIFVVKWEANGTAIKWSLGFETIDSKFSNGVGNLTSDATLIGLGGSPLVEGTTIQGGTGSPLTPSYEFNFDNLTSLNLDASEHSSALFRIESTTKGSKFAGTMDTTQRDAIATPLEGISVYNSDDNEYQYYNGSSWSSFGAVTSPAGADTEIQYNNAGAFGASADFIWDNTIKNISIRDGANGWDFFASADEVQQIRQIGGGGTANLLLSDVDFSATTTLNSSVFGRNISTANIGNQSAYFGNNHTGFSGTNNVVAGYSIGGTAGSDKTAFGHGVTVDGNDCTGIGSGVTATSGGIGIGKDTSQTGSKSIVLNGTDNGNANYLVIGSTTREIDEVHIGRGIIHTVLNSAGQNVRYNGMGGYGTDQKGGDVRIAGGRGTGSNVSGDVWMQLTYSNVTGTTLRTRTDYFGVGHFGSGEGVIQIKDSITVPSANPSGGGFLYVEAGALKYRGSSGTITTLGVA